MNQTGRALEPGARRGALLSLRRCRRESCTLPLLALTTACVAVAEEEGRTREVARFLVDVRADRTSIDGDFDGDTILVGSNDVILVPSIDDGGGWGAGLGTGTASASIELSFDHTSHDVPALRSRAHLNVASIDGRIFFWSDRFLRPYVQLGFCVPWMRIGNASLDQFGDVGDGQFRGWGLDLGAGVAGRFPAHLGLYAGVLFRWIRYTKAEGEGDIEGRLDDELDGSGPSLQAGLTWTF